jgi:hypothetical protein
LVRVVFAVAFLGLVSSAMAQGLQPVERDPRVAQLVQRWNAYMDGVRASIVELQGLLQKADMEAKSDLDKMLAQVKQERAVAAANAEAKAKAKAEADAKAKASANAEVGPQPIPMEPK